MCHKTGVNDLSLEIKYSDWLSRSGDKSQDRGHWPFVSHMTQTSSNFVSLSPLGERMSLHFWFFCWFFFLSHTSLSLMWESGLYIVSSNEQIGQTERVSLYIVDSQQIADLSKWERVILHCLFPANRSFLKVREGYFALLIPSKWEFSKEYVQTIKCLLHSSPSQGNWLFQSILNEGVVWCYFFSGSCLSFLEDS